MAEYNAENRVGRPPLSDNGVTKTCAFKCSGELKHRLLGEVRRLNKAGYSTNESELVRLLVEFGIEKVDLIYKKAKGSKKSKSNLKESA